MKKQQLSALVDNELEGDEAATLLSGLGRDAQLRTHWERYHLISDALSNHLTSHLGPELVDRVRAVVEQEPSYLIGRRREWLRAGRATAGVALAASLFGVAVIGGKLLDSGNGFTPEVSVASLAGGGEKSAPAELDGAGSGGMRWNRVDPGMESRLNGFLVSHSTYVDRMSPMQPYARVVSYHGSP
jgi:hypothetical protein